MRASILFTSLQNRLQIVSTTPTLVNCISINHIVLRLAQSAFCDEIGHKCKLCPFLDSQTSGIMFPNASESSLHVISFVMTPPNGNYKRDFLVSKFRSDF